MSSNFYQRIHYNSKAAGASILGRRNQTEVKLVGFKIAFTFTFPIRAP